jgi:hypothetical protein
MQATTRSRPGRPLKFGRPSRVITVTLPEDIIETLRATDADLGRAIVSVADGTRGVSAGSQGARKVVELMRTGRRESLIVIDPTAVPSLPRCAFIRIGPHRAFMALDPGSGLADLELSVVDRVDDPDVTRDQRRALRTLRAALRRWRQDASVSISARSIVLLESGV